MALMSAAHEGHSDVLQILLSAGADLNVRDKVMHSFIVYMMTVSHCYRVLAL